MSRKKNTTAVYYTARSGEKDALRGGWLVTARAGIEFVEATHARDDALRSRYPDAEVDPVPHRIAADYLDLMARTYAGKEATR
jgi:hypothetical protein